MTDMTHISETADEVTDASEESGATAKVTFASRAWVDLARAVLEQLVAEHGEPGVSFSACEIFTDAPPGMAGAGMAVEDDTTAAWHFRIDGKTVTVGAGAIDGAVMNVRADYTATLPLARLVYTPEVLAERERNPKQPEGDASGRSQAPPYLVELHNRLAERTL